MNFRKGSKNRNESCSQISKSHSYKQKISFGGPPVGHLCNVILFMSMRLLISVGNFRYVLEPNLGNLADKLDLGVQ